MPMPRCHSILHVTYLPLNVQALHCKPDDNYRCCTTDLGVLLIFNIFMLASLYSIETFTR